jgi:hypothetical protein
MPAANKRDDIQKLSPATAAGAFRILPQIEKTAQKRARHGLHSCRSCPSTFRRSRIQMGQLFQLLAPYELANALKLQLLRQYSLFDNLVKKIPLSRAAVHSAKRAAPKTIFTAETQSTQRDT